MTLQADFAATVVDEWLRAGVTDVVVAPGSRSTPLVLAVAASTLQVHVHLDERSAGFFALGLAIASGRPAPVIVTSGTAAAELVAAAVEAHHSRVPMILCTADRPPELHGVGAPQTIDQTRLYGGLLRWKLDVVAGDVPVSAWRSLASRSVVSAVAGPAGPGPVQLNLGFRDPLVGEGLEPPGREGRRPWHVSARAGPSRVTVPPALLDGRRGVIVAGGGIADPRAVIEAAAALGWPVLAGPESGCRGQGSVAVVSAFDALLRTERMGTPDVVLRIGRPPASKVLSGWLHSCGAEQVVADPFGAWPDPERTASTVIAEAPTAICRAVVDAGPAAAPADWLSSWAAAEQAAQRAVASVLAAHPEVTEPGVARAVTGALPASAALVVASSMPIRDVEWYGDPAMQCRLVANRGANGIDGLVSTTLGVAAGTDAGPVVGLLGDLAFLHDAGGLLHARERGVACTFVVVDNNGGGIFSFLPQATEVPPARFEQLFGTPHGIDLAALAAVHGIAASVVDAASGVAPAVVAGAEHDGVRLVMVRTDRGANVAVHDELVAAVAAAVR